jgi:hypothetical protein
MTLNKTEEIEDTEESDLWRFETIVWGLNVIVSNDLVSFSLYPTRFRKKILIRFLFIGIIFKKNPFFKSLTLRRINLFFGEDTTQMLDRNIFHPLYHFGDLEKKMMNIPHQDLRRSFENNSGLILRR